MAAEASVVSLDEPDRNDGAACEAFRPGLATGPADTRPVLDIRGASRANKLQKSCPAVIPPDPWQTQP